MLVSQVTIDDIKDYIRIDGIDEDNFVSVILAAAKSFIRGYTGLTVEELDNYEDITNVVFCLCAEMYDNRQFTVDKGQVNPFVKIVLDLYSKSLL